MAIFVKHQLVKLKSGGHSMVVVQVNTDIEDALAGLVVLEEDKRISCLWMLDNGTPYQSEFSAGCLEAINKE